MLEPDALLAQLGPRLRDARLNANMTVREAASQLKVNHSMIVRYENGDSLPPLDRLVALATIYNLTPAMLLAQHPAAMALIGVIDQANTTVLQRLTAILATGFGHSQPNNTP